MGNRTSPLALLAAVAGVPMAGLAQTVSASGAADSAPATQAQIQALQQQVAQAQSAGLPHRGH